MGDNWHIAAGLFVGIILGFALSSLIITAWRAMPW